MVRRIDQSGSRRGWGVKGEPFRLLGPVAGIEQPFLAKSKVQPDATQGVTIAARGHGNPIDDCQTLLGQQPQIGPGVRVAVLNAMGGRDSVKFIALLVQGIPRSMKVDDHLQRASAELAPLELDAVQLGEAVVKIPDLIGLEQKLADAGLI